MNIRDEVLAKVEAYRAKTGQSETAFGIAVARNPSLIPRIRENGGTLKTIEKVLAYMEANEPNA